MTLTTKDATDRNDENIPSDDHHVTDPTMPTPTTDDPEDRHSATIAALIKIFATGRGDSHAEPEMRRPQ